VWIRDGWHERFGMPADPDDRDVGWTAEQVAAWTPPAKEAQMGYYETVKQASRAYLNALSYADLEARRVVPPTPEPRTSLGDGAGDLGQRGARWPDCLPAGHDARHGVVSSLGAA
jgi:hypothetical protein